MIMKVFKLWDYVRLYRYKLKYFIGKILNYLKLVVAIFGSCCIYRQWKQTDYYERSPTDWLSAGINVGVLLLTVLNSTAEDSGPFWCVADNGIGNVEVKNATYLLVRRKLIFNYVYNYQFILYPYRQQFVMDKTNFMIDNIHTIK